MSDGELRDCIALLGDELEPWRCARLAWENGIITVVDQVAPAPSVDDGALVLIPGLCNGHTHVGDSAWPDGATGLTLEEAFFRPDGFKYRELARLSPEQHLPHLVAHLQYMARTGTVRHIDFREQGVVGAQVLRAASHATGVESLILSQFAAAPFATVALEANAASLPAEARQELAAMLDIADGFSESTMNDLTEPAWREIREVTARRGRLRAIHCLENAGYRDVSLARTGRGDLARALDVFDPHLVIHLTVATADEIALLAASGRSGVINPRANAALGLPLPPVRDLLEAGVNLLLGTDNGMLNSPNLFAELDFTYKLARSQYGDALRPDPRTILRMVTTNVAKALGESPGGIATGRAATFAVLDFRQPHLRATRHVPASVVSRVTPADVLATYRRGRELFRAPAWAPAS